ncbi:MAG: site-specific integrase [Burkholderiales bacterium]|nr:site-specific integrase [Burkholderiales bacterium]
MQNETFKAAFRSWADSNFGLAKASREVYESIWNAFSEFSRARTPTQVDAADIAGYLESRADSPEGLTPRYQARVVMLIDKVLSHEAQVAGRKSPKAVRELLRNNAALRTAMSRHRCDGPDLEYLDQPQFERLVEVLLAWPRDSARPGRQPRWQDARDRTSTALLLAAGLSPTDIRSLHWRAAARDGPPATAFDGTRSLRVPKNGRLARRTARIDAWAIPLLDDWLDLFEAQSVDSDWLFPGRKQSAVAWSKMAQYESARDIMQAAGIEGSSFMLRHTWALKTLAEGAAESEVARRLGVLDDEVMARYCDELAEFRSRWQPS